MTASARRRLLKRLLSARDGRAALALARAHAAVLDDELARALVDAFNRLVRQSPGKADAAVRAVSAVARAAGDPPLLQARARACSGVLARVRGRSAEAARELTAAAALFMRAGRLLEAGDVHRVLVDVNREAGDRRAALAAGRRAEAAYEKAGGADPRRQASLAMHLADVERHAGRPDLALPRLDTALRQAKRSGDRLLQANVAYNRANALSTLDRNEAARESYDQAREAFAAESFEALVAQCDYAVATIDLLEGALDTCLDRLQDARARQERLGDRPGMAHCDLERAEAYLRLNRPAECEAAARKALAWFRRAKQSTEVAEATGLLAGAALQRGQAVAARRLFQSARELHAKAGHRLGVALDDMRLSRAELLAGRPGAGVQAARRALRVLSGLGLGSREARALALGAEAALAAARPALARSWAERGLALSRKKKDRRAELGSLLVLARLHERRGEGAEAHRRLLAAERCVESLRCGVSAVESQLAFALDKAEVFEALVANRLAVGTKAALRQALAHAERAKARALAERVARSRVAPDTASDDPKARRLLQKIARIDRELARAEARLDEPTGRQGLRGHAVPRTGPPPREVEALEDGRLRSLRLLSGRAPARAALLGAPPPDPWEGIRSLAPGELALAYVEAEGHFHLFLIDGEELEAWPRIARVDEVKDLLALLRFQLGKAGLGPGHVERFGGFLDRALAVHLRRLHDLLLSPVAQRLRDRSVRIIPHGVLHGLPFHALLDGDVPLVETSFVAQAPSLAVAGLLARGLGAPTAAPLILGIPDDAAPEIEAEVAAVQAQLPGARVFRGVAATEESLRLSESRPSVLHVASHGYFDEAGGGRGGLRLGDAWVSLREVYSLRGTAELVVLSGCETGRGIVHSGDEWVGLVRGFLQAGARTVVATLWEVHDRTAGQLMGDFYTQLSAGRPVGEALALAQRKARASGSSVLQWAPFSVVGDPRLRLSARRKVA